MRKIVQVSVFLVALVISVTAQQNSTSAIVKKCAPAVVLIEGKTPGHMTLGTGFIISPDGKIATSLHVIQNLDSAQVHLTNGDVYDSFAVLAFDERRDIAIIQVGGFELPVIELGNSSALSAGDPTLVIGSPKGLEGTVTSGIVSAIRELGDGFKVIQTDAAVNPGNSGGPLINQNGEAVGVVGFKLRNAENLNFAVPINYVRGLLSNPQGPMALEAMRLRMGKTKEVGESPSTPSQEFASRWKAVATGMVSIVRFDGDFIYIERVFSDDQKQAGVSNIGQVRKSGNVYLGVIHVRFPCQYYREWAVKWDVNYYSSDLPVEITSVLPTRIEGRFLAPPPDAKFQCNKQSYNKKPVWQSFVLIPES